MMRRGVGTWALGIGGIIAVAANTAAAQTPLFRAAQTYNLSGSPSDALGILAVADVGSPGNPPGPPDHILDLITANQTENVAVLLGNGTGGFTSGVASEIGRIPTALAVADFDEDQIPDVVVTDTGSIVFLRGNNDGTFQPPGAAVPAGPGPTAIAVTDVNGDHHLDAIIVDEGDFSAFGSVTILLGNGDGTFRAPGVRVQAGAGSVAVALVDTNGDGTPDQLAVANAGDSTVTILQGDGSGNFGPGETLNLPPVPPVTREPVAIGASDMNGDHHPDLVVVSQSTDEVGIFDGAADGTYGTPRFFPSGTMGSAPNGLVLTDVNRDGHTDVAVSNHFSSDASALLGDGQGNLAAARSFVTDQEPLAIVADRFNSDLFPDVVTINVGLNTPNVAVLPGQADGTLAGVEDVAIEPDATGVVGGDIDNDGIADLVVAHRSGDVLLYRADPTVGFAAPMTKHSGGDTIGIGRGDLNADGRLDLVTVNKSTTDVSVFLGTANGNFTDAQNFSVGSGATAVAVGDWNGDGRADVAVARQGGGPSGAVDILLAKPDGSLGAPATVPVSQFPTSVDFGDFNNDGKRDLVIGTSQDVSLLLGNGNGTFQPVTSIPGTGGGAVAVAVADFDRDGFDDLAVAKPVGANSGVALFYGNGQGAFTAVGQPLRVSGFVSGLFVRDVTGDSFPDVLVTDQTSNAVSVFVRSGSSRLFVRDSVITVSRQPVRMVAADFDGDGRYDGAALNSAVASSVSVLTNIRATPVLRGDGNGDAVVSAADAVAVMRKLGDGTDLRIEQVRVSSGSYPAAPGVDANGDGVVSLQDALAVAHRLFPGV